MESTENKNDIKSETSDLAQKILNQPLSDGNTEVKQTSSLIILFWLIIFAPIGLYLLWKEKRLHSWFPNLLIFFGFINILPVATMIFFVFPKLTKLYEEFGTNFNKNNFIIVAVAILVVSLVEVITGLFLRKKVKKEGFLTNAFIFLCLGFFVFQYVPFGWLTRSLVLESIIPIYNLTSSIQNLPTPTSGKLPTNVKIISSEVTVEECKIKIITTKGINYINTYYFEYTPQTKCYQFVLNKVSPSGKYVVFQDISGGIDSMLRVYSLEHNDTYQLDVLGTSNIFDISFLPGDKLICLYGYRGNYNEQYLRIYNLPGLFLNFSSNIHKQYKYFTNVSLYTKGINLPDIGKDYSNLSVSDEMIKVYGHSGAILKEYNFDELTK